MKDEKTILSTHLISFEGVHSNLPNDPVTSSIKPRPSSSGTSVFAASAQHKNESQNHRVHKMVNDNDSDLRSNFKPPELGALLWAFSYCNASEVESEA